MSVSNLYVANLPEGTDESALRQLCEPFGTVESVKVANSQGGGPVYGFVKLETPEMARYAIDGLRGLQMGNSLITVKLALNEPGANKGPGTAFGKGPPLVGAGTNVYVAGVPEACTQTEFGEFWTGYGTVMSTKLSDQSRNGTRIGFVNFATPEEAASAIAQTNGMPLGESVLQVKLANNSAKGGGAAMPAMVGKGAVPATMDFGKGSIGMAKGGAAEIAQQAAPYVPPSDNLYVKGLPKGMAEDGVKSVFSNYGQVVQCKVMESAGPQLTAVAMVRMSSVEEATWIVQNLDGNIPHGLDTPVSVNFANPSKSQVAGMTNGAGKGGYGKWDGAAGAGASNRYSPYGVAEAEQAASGTTTHESMATPEMMQAISETVSQVKGFKQVPWYEEDPSSVHVQGLAPGADELYIYYVFAPFGAIQSVTVVKDEVTGECKGDAYVKFGLAEDANLAMNTIGGNQLPDGSMLDVFVKAVSKGKGKGGWK